MGNCIIHKRKFQDHLDKDFDIFKGENIQCFGNDIENCSALDRLTHALKYHSTLNNEEFTNFCVNIYKNALNDYVHFMIIHSQQVEQLNNKLIQRDDVSVCAVSECNTFRRHYSNRRQKMKNGETYTFYIDLFDRFHHFIHHLFDIGLRVATNEVDDDDNKETNEQYIDCIFRKKQNIISHKRHEHNINRFNDNNNNKYSLNTENNKNINVYGQTMVDSLLNQIDNKLGKSSNNLFHHFIINEQYDSDTIIDDIQLICKNQSNIYLEIQNAQMAQLISSFVDNTKLLEWSFSTGIIWFYWHYYKNKKAMKQQIPWNVNDYGGHQIHELYVNKKYHSYKHEVLQYISIQEYNEFVYQKAVKYSLSDKIKAMKPNILCTKWNQLHYGINAKHSPNLNHIQSIIMYCDFTDYSTAFSATFRAVGPFESLISIKERNSKFWWQSKSLREMVECYGIFGYDEDDDTIPLLSGPFYCGIGMLMIMPQFCIRICSPTSTSKNIEVSMNFAKTDGIIIQLNNNGHARAASIPLFDCSWISRYNEESEILLCGGWMTIRIESIRIIATQQNFEEFFHSLFILDMMLNGQRLSDEKIIDSDVLLLNKLTKHSNGELVEGNINSYMLSTFKLFSYNKDNITINLDLLHDYFKELSHLFIETDLKATHYKSVHSVVFGEMKDKSNLISPNIFRVFKNVKTITIHTTDGYDDDDIYYAYIFDFMYFLETILLSTSWTQITIKARRRQQYKYLDTKEEKSKHKYKHKHEYYGEYRIIFSWIHILWESSFDIQSKYNQNKIKTNLKQNTFKDGDNVYVEDSLIICRVST